MKTKTILALTLLVTSIFIGISMVSGSGDHDHSDEETEGCTVEKQIIIKASTTDMAFEREEYQVDKNTCYNVIFQNFDDIEHDMNIDPNSDVGFEGIHLHVESSTTGSNGNGTSSAPIMMPNEDTELEMYCSVGAHRSQGMEAVLIVGEGNKGLLPLNYSYVILALAFMIAIPRIMNKK